mgnify:CR=1 FL=1
MKDQLIKFIGQPVALKQADNFIFGHLQSNAEKDKFAVGGNPFSEENVKEVAEIDTEIRKDQTGVWSKNVIRAAIHLKTE